MPRRQHRASSLQSPVPVAPEHEGCWLKRSTRRFCREHRGGWRGPTLQHLGRPRVRPQLGPEQADEPSVEPDLEPTETGLRVARFWDADGATCPRGESSFVKSRAHGCVLPFPSGSWALSCMGGVWPLCSLLPRPHSHLPSSLVLLPRDTRQDTEVRCGLHWERGALPNLIWLVLCRQPAMALHLFIQTHQEPQRVVGRARFPYMRYPSPIHLSMSNVGGRGSHWLRLGQFEP